ILVEKIFNEKCKRSVIDDIVPYITRCTLDIICETAMGVKIDAQSNPDSEYVKAIYFLGESFLYRNLHFSGRFDLTFYRSHFGKRYVKILKDVHDFTRKVIHDRKEEMIKSYKQKEEEKDNKNATGEDSIIGRKKRMAFLDL